MRLRTHEAVRRRHFAVVRYRGGIKIGTGRGGVSLAPGFRSAIEEADGRGRCDASVFRSIRARVGTRAELFGHIGRSAAVCGAGFQPAPRGFVRVSDSVIYTFHGARCGRLKSLLASSSLLVPTRSVGTRGRIAFGKRGHQCGECLFGSSAGLAVMLPSVMWICCSTMTRYLPP